MQTARGPCCENDIIFEATSSPAAMVMTCGVKPIPAEPTTHSPSAAKRCFLPEPGGRPLPRFCRGEKGVPGAEAESGAKAKAMLPSGPYFRGLPRFFFMESSNPVAMVMARLLFAVILGGVWAAEEFTALGLLLVLLFTLLLLLFAGLPATAAGAEDGVCKPVEAAITLLLLLLLMLLLLAPDCPDGGGIPIEDSLPSIHKISKYRHRATP